jgi:Tetratricopeptide repeat/FlgO protein
MALSGIRSLIVRSTIASARFAGPSPDLREIASTLDVDVVLVGTLLPAGDRVRVAAQLVEAPAGEVVWSQTLDVQGEDIFQIQDTITKRIVESLQLPLSARERGALGSDVPASAAAYELFLRANRIGIVGENSAIARDLYQRALEADPDYAPAWARLGRCQRVLGKYFAGGREDNYRRAHDSLGRALELHPDLPSAQYFLAQLELDRGHTHPALDRLLTVIDRNPNDPNGYTGLVTAFRYVGLLEESLAAHRRARQLDPEASTSVHYTLVSMGRYDEALDEENDPHGAIVGWLEAHRGKTAEGIAWLRRIEQREPGNMVGSIAALIRAAIENDVATGEAVLEQAGGFPDPEGLVLHASAGVKLGIHDRSIDLLVRGMTGGYANAAFVREDAWFEPVLGDPRVVEALAAADEITRRATATHGGRLR